MTRGRRYDDTEVWKECLCGCGKPILRTSRQKSYKPACRVRAARDRRAKGIPAKKQNRKNADGPKSQEEQEIDELEEHYLRVRLQKGEIMVCDRCGAVLVTDAEGPVELHCALCKSILALEDDGHG